jgi:hypothetical protein
VSIIEDMIVILVLFVPLILIFVERNKVCGAPAGVH